MGRIGEERRGVGRGLNHKYYHRMYKGTYSVEVRLIDTARFTSYFMKIFHHFRLHVLI